MRIRHLGICIVVGGSLLLLSPLSAQSLGEVARASKTSKKASRVITNDTLPEAKGPANGAAILPASESDNQTASADAKADQDATKGKDASDSADSPKQAEPEKELREQVGFLTSQIASLNARMEGETNQATRDAMQKLAENYQAQRDQSQQQLDELVAAKNKDKAAK